VSTIEVLWVVVVGHVEGLMEDQYPPGPYYELLLPHEIFMILKEFVLFLGRGFVCKHVSKSRSWKSKLKGDGGTNF
jgi:hypothetical protein